MGDWLPQKLGVEKGDGRGNGIGYDRDVPPLWETDDGDGGAVYAR